MYLSSGDEGKTPSISRHRHFRARIPFFSPVLSSSRLGRTANCVLCEQAYLFSFIVNCFFFWFLFSHLLHSFSEMIAWFLLLLLLLSVILRGCLWYNDNRKLVLRSICVATNWIRWLSIITSIQYLIAGRRSKSIFSPHWHRSRHPMPTPLSSMNAQRDSRRRDLILWHNGTSNSDFSKSTLKN